MIDNEIQDWLQILIGCIIALALIIYFLSETNAPTAYKGSVFEEVAHATEGIRD